MRMCILEIFFIKKVNTPTSKQNFPSGVPLTGARGTAQNGRLCSLTCAYTVSPLSEEENERQHCQGSISGSRSGVTSGSYLGRLHETCALPLCHCETQRNGVYSVKELWKSAQHCLNSGTYEATANAPSSTKICDLLTAGHRSQSTKIFGV